MIFDNSATTKSKFTFAKVIVAIVFGILCIIGVGVSLAMGFIGWGWFSFTTIFLVASLLIIRSGEQSFKRVKVQIDDDGVAVDKNGKSYKYEWSDISGARLVQTSRTQHVGVAYEVQIVRKSAIVEEGSADVIPDMTDYLNEITNAINEGVERWRNNNS